MIELVVVCAALEGVVIVGVVVCGAVVVAAALTEQTRVYVSLLLQKK